MGCGCLALGVLAIAGLVFFLYASTDPGPPVESAILALAFARIIGMTRALGVRRAR